MKWIIGLLMHSVAKYCSYPKKKKIEKKIEKIFKLHSFVTVDNSLHSHYQIQILLDFPPLGWKIGHDRFP